MNRETKLLQSVVKKIDILDICMNKTDIPFIARDFTPLVECNGLYWPMKINLYKIYNKNTGHLESLGEILEAIETPGSYRMETEFVQFLEKLNIKLETIIMNLEEIRKCELAKPEYAALLQYDRLARLSRISLGLYIALIKPIPIEVSEIYYNMPVYMLREIACYSNYSNGKTKG